MQNSAERDMSAYSPDRQMLQKIEINTREAYKPQFEMVSSPSMLMEGMDQLMKELPMDSGGE